LGVLEVIAWEKLDGTTEVTKVEVHIGKDAEDTRP